MASDGEKWRYLIITRLSALLKKITFKDKGNLYCLDSLRSSKNMLNSHEKAFMNGKYCQVVLPDKDARIL